MKLLFMCLCCCCLGRVRFMGNALPFSALMGGGGLGLCGGEDLIDVGDDDEAEGEGGEWVWLETERSISVVVRRSMDSGMVW